ncbi:MAG: 7,8-didemethyl-8-hydroxy-5-deazariboflavin synthase subunit CofG, partial [Halobacteria archaeon]|nr:7,8-didemethyl-8-hydroxy-5-deazariboflavin synthase subunit CofG [Halobacteria archaeon]
VEVDEPRAAVTIRSGEWPPAEGTGDAAIQSFDADVDESAVRSTVTGYEEVVEGDVEVPDEVTFAKNVFLPLTTACTNACDYCAFYDTAENAEVMTHEEVRDTLERGVEAGCTEALFSFGTRPEVYPSIDDELSSMGYDGVLDYLYDACETALELGILPHSNPGYLERDEIERLSEVNASMGLMLETTAEVEAHEGYETKKPEKRIEVIENAGDVGVPFTTGFLVGIGETWR